MLVLTHPGAREETKTPCFVGEFAERREVAVRQLTALPATGGESGDGLPAKRSPSPPSISTAQEPVSRLVATGIASFPTHVVKPSSLLTRTGIAVAVKPQLSSLPPKPQPSQGTLLPTSTVPPTKALQPLPSKPAAVESDALFGLPVNVSPVKSSGLGALPPMGGRRPTPTSVRVHPFVFCLRVAG